MEAFDSSGPLRHMSFKYEFRFKPVDYDGIWAAPIYSGTADTALYMLGTRMACAGAGNEFEQWAWTFNIPSQATTCGNCGEPGLRIYEEIP